MEDNCAICSDPVDKDSKSTWKQVTGFVGGPRKDSMRLREDTGKYAHDNCVLQLQRGIARDQEELFTESNSEANTTTDSDADNLGL